MRLKARFDNTDGSCVINACVPSVTAQLVAIHWIKYLFWKLFKGFKKCKNVELFQYKDFFFNNISVNERLLTNFYITCPDSNITNKEDSSVGYFDNILNHLFFC